MIKDYKIYTFVWMKMESIYSFIINQHEMHVRKMCVKKKKQHFIFTHMKKDIFRVFSAFEFSTFLTPPSKTLINSFTKYFSEIHPIKGKSKSHVSWRKRWDKSCIFYIVNFQRNTYYFQDNFFIFYSLFLYITPKRNMDFFLEGQENYLECKWEFYKIFIDVK